MARTTAGTRTNTGRAFSLTIDANNAITLNGTTQYGQAATYAALSALSGSSVTVEGWFYSDATNAAYSDWATFFNGASLYFSARNDSGANNLQAVWYSATNAYAGNFSAPVYSTNAWHHRATVYNATSRTVTNYVDGIAYTSQFAQTGVGAEPTFTSAKFGLGNNNAGSLYKGRVSCVRVWNRALSPTQILANKNLYLDPNQELGLIGNWNFNQGSGTSVANTVSTGTAMTLTGTPTWSSGPTMTVKSYLRTVAGTRTLA